MKPTNINYSSNPFLVATLAIGMGSTLLNMHNYDSTAIDIPINTESYKWMSNNHPWENNLYLYSVDDKQLKEFELVSSFANELINNCKDVDSEIQVVTNDIFWDLI